MRLKNGGLRSTVTKLKGSLIVWLILMSMLLQNKGVSSQDPDLEPDPEDNAAAEAGVGSDSADNPEDNAAAEAGVSSDSADNPEDNAAAAEADMSSDSPDEPVDDAAAGAITEKNQPNETTTKIDESLMERFQSKPIFQRNKCTDDMRCTIEGANETRVHTLCRDIEIPRCDRHRVYTIFKVDSIKQIELQEMIVNGHNGLRNRIAEKMHVGNMVELVWDDQLAEMTIAHYLQCASDVDDPCTNFTMPADQEPSSTDYHEEEHFKWVAQNRFNMKAEFFPTNFIEVALRSWYFEKDRLVRPTLKTVELLGITHGILKGENNFVHMAYPLTFRIGCSMAQIDKSFSLICNYYPFYRFVDENHEHEMTFAYDRPAGFCPTYFPLKHEYFPNLCTDKFSRASKQMSFSLRVSALLIIIWFIWHRE